MSGRPITSQVLSGLWLSANVLFAIITAGILVIGMYLLCFSDQADPNFFAGRHPLAVGIALLTMAVAIMVPTINRWVRILPGILAYSVLGGLIAIATGHLSGSSVKIARSDATILTILLIASTALSSSFGGRKLSLLDKISLMAFVLCIAMSAVTKPPIMFGPVGVGLAFLLTAWVTYHLQSRRCHKS